MKRYKVTDVDAAKYPYASFCYGRGWRGHKTAEAAKKAAQKDANACVRQYGGGEPQHLECMSDGTPIDWTTEVA